jgi:hypothetical protein
VHNISPTSTTKTSQRPCSTNDVLRRKSQTTGEPLDCEVRLRCGSDGVYRWFQTRVRPLPDNRGKIVKWCGVANDIEDRKVAEQLRVDLTHASRVSTMGELVASISHSPLQSQPLTPRHLCDGFSATRPK